MKSKIDSVTQSGLCISCGACAGVSRAITLKYSANTGMYLPKTTSEISSAERQLADDVCVGDGYRILALSRELFGEEDNVYDLFLGRYQKLWAAKTLTPDLLERASSGGAMTAVAKYLLYEGLVDGVVCTQMDYGGEIPRAKTFIAKSVEELKFAQGSKYQPVPALEILREIELSSERLLFIGTPCQIASLKLAQNACPDRYANIKYTMANFCGGFRDVRETDKIIRRLGMKPHEVVDFRYRGGGQPGSMKLLDVKGKTARANYPEYSRMTGVTKHKRCRLCVDATGELADFSFGDAWLRKFLDTGEGWSLIIARSKKAIAVIQDMERRNLLLLEKVTADEVKLSQQGNMTTKKRRQEARVRLYRVLGMRTPFFDGGYLRGAGSAFLEAKVFISHLFLSTLERVGLYVVFAKLIRRYPKN